MIIDLTEAIEADAKDRCDVIKDRRGVWCMVHSLYATKPGMRYCADGFKESCTHLTRGGAQ